MKKLFTAICALLVMGAYTTTKAQDQAAAIVFTKTVHDFGSVLQSGGPVTCTFEFTNTGNAPLVVNNVSASCGCTSPGWTKEPIAPGAKGNVQATYSPSGVTTFDKSLTVYTNGNPQTVTLHIKGNVVPKPIDLKEVYPNTIGDLRLKTTSAQMGLITSDAPKTITLETANATDAPVSYSFDKTPEYITVSAEPATLQPKQQGLIKITYNVDKKKAYGYSKDVLNVKAGDQKGTITVSTILQQKMAATVNADIAPRVSIKSNLFDFGTIEKAKAVTATFNITNEGKSDLIITNLTSENTGLKSSIKNLKIKSGKTETIKLSYTPDKTGTNMCKAYIATNDPGNTLYELIIQGTVK